MRVGSRREMYQKSGVVTLRRSRSFLYFRRPSPALVISKGLQERAPLRRHLLSYCEPPQARSRRSLLARTVDHSSSQRASRASACLHLRKHQEHQEHQRRHPTTFLSMTCCAYETTGIAGPLVRYLPPQKLSPPLLTHSLTGSSSRGAKLCDLITDP